MLLDSVMPEYDLDARHGILVSVPPGWTEQNRSSQNGINGPKRTRPTYNLTNGDSMIWQEPLQATEKRTSPQQHGIA